MSVDTDPARTAEAKAKDVGLRHAAIVTLAREEGRVSDDGTDHPGLLVVTNNLNVASRLRPSAQHEVIVAGGVVRPTDGGIVGASTAEFLRQFRVDYALVGTSAIDADGGIYDFDLREVNVLRAIIENARAAILVADSTQFARRAPIRVAGLADFDVFVTVEAPVSIEQVCRACRRVLIQTKASD